MLRSNRLRGQGLPLNVIIIAILGIIALVVLVAIFTGQTAKFGKETRALTESYCAPDSGEGIGKKELVGECAEPIYGKFKDITPGYICCKKTVTK